MPNLFETIRSYWPRSVIDRDLTINDGGVKAQNLRLAQAGIHIEGCNNRLLSSYLIALSDEDLYCLGKMVTDPEQQVWFFDPTNNNYYDVLETVSTLGRLLKSGDLINRDTQTDKLQQINLAIAAFVKKSDYVFAKNNRRWGKPFNRYVYVLGRIVQNPELYALFDNDPGLVAAKTLKMFNSSASNPDDVVDFFRTVPDNSREIIEAVNLFLRLPWEEVRLILRYGRIFGKYPQALAVYETFQKSQRNWGDRYLFFRDLCITTGGLPLSAQALSELLTARMSPQSRSRYDQRDPADKFLTIGAIKRRLGYDALREISLSNTRLYQTAAREQQKIAKKIARDENPDLPVITMGIAATQGTEVEFPDDQETMSAVIASDFANVTEELGIHWGDGGIGCAEIAPGPFYHPETMIAYFKIMQDLGFIDFYQYKGLTLHFNPGVEMKGLNHLILAQYLGNTLADTSMFSDFSRANGFSFQIYTEAPGVVDEYTECKSFLCETPAETELGLTQIGYLSWSLKCHQRSALTPTKAGKQMAAVWRKYVADLNAGTKSVGLTNLFCDEEVPVSKKMLNRMIALVDEVVPDYRARFKDPNSITTTNPVTVNGRRWPNIVAFARSIGNEAIEEIKSIERDINLGATKKIREINRSTGKNRKTKILDFIEEYRPASEAETLQEKLQEVRLSAQALGLLGLETA